MEKELAAGLSAIIVLCSMGYYVVQVLRRAIIPHAFSWFVWLVATLIVLAGLVAKDEGAAVWRNVFMAVACAVVFVVSLTNGSRYIRPLDWLMLAGALAAIPVWLATDDPTYAAAWLLLVEGLAAIPTIRKVYAHPFDDSLLASFANMFSQLLALYSLQHYSLMGIIYFGGWAAMQWVFCVVATWRRMALAGNVRRKPT
jgi:hypothetical protein